MIDKSRLLGTGCVKSSHPPTQSWKRNHNKIGKFKKKQLVQQKVSKKTFCRCPWVFIVMNIWIRLILSDAKDTTNMLSSAQLNLSKSILEKGSSPLEHNRTWMPLLLRRYFKSHMSWNQASPDWEDFESNSHFCCSKGFRINLFAVESASKIAPMRLWCCRRGTVFRQYFPWNRER